MKYTHSARSSRAFFPRLVVLTALLALALLPPDLHAVTTTISYLDTEDKTPPLVIAFGDIDRLNVTGSNIATQSGLISGAGNVTKINAGTLILTAANTYSGGTQINAGTVRLSGSGTLGDTSGTLSFIQANGTLDLNGTSQTIGRLASLDFSGDLNPSATGAATGAIVNNATGTATLTLGSGNTGSTFFGIIADHTSGEGFVALTKTGTGTQTLSGANTYSGGTTVNAGTLSLGTQANDALGTGAVTVNASATLHLDRNTLGNNLTLDGGTLAGDNGFGDSVHGTVSLTATSTVSNEYDMALTNTVSGAGGLTKVNSGTLTFSGTNTYTGATTVSAGTLLVTGSLAAGSAVTVASGGTLGGSGTIGGATTIQSGGTLAAGNSPGLLTFNSTLTLAADSTSVFQIDSATRGTGYDAVNVAGLMTYGGTLNLVFGTTLADGVTLDLFGLTGGFASDFSAITATGLYSGSFTDNGDTWTLTTDGQTLTFSDSTGDLSVSAASAVPEPSTYATLAGVCALALAIYRRRRTA